MPEQKTVNLINPNIKLKPSNLVAYKSNERTPFYLSIVGKLTKKLDEKICAENHTNHKIGYDHIGMIDRCKETLDNFPEFLLHEHSPRASRDELSELYWRKDMLNQHDIEIWEYNKDLTSIQIERIINSYWTLTQLIWNQKQQKYIGLKYNWPAIFLSPFALIGLGVKTNAMHCAESIFESWKCENIILSPSGATDCLVSPNEIINSGLFKRIYTVHMVSKTNKIIITYA